MFGPVRGPWPDDDWKGWCGGNPPYHTPVFVLTHHPREFLPMQGGTTFHFVTGGIHEALAQARAAAGRPGSSPMARGIPERHGARLGLYIEANERRRSCRMSSAKCQSCGMPLRADPTGGGTNADGTVSGKYCGYCYRNGEFVAPDMTIEEMRTLVMEKLGEQGFPRFVARFFASGLGRLERWR